MFAAITLFLIPLLFLLPLGAKVNIGDIKANPAAYYGKTVCITGEYRGWRGNYGLPPVTRSDWVIKDSTGWIYVTGRVPRLNPTSDIGRIVEVTGQVAMTQTQVYIVAKIVKMYPVNRTLILP